MKKILLIIITLIPLASAAILAYSSGDTDVAMIDTEVCINCGACYLVAPEDLEIIAKSDEDHPYWVPENGSKDEIGILRYHNPTPEHKIIIKEDLVPICPMGVFVVNW